MKCLHLLVHSVLCLLYTSFAFAQSQKNKTILFANGHWFNGAGFEKKNVYVREGVLHFNKTVKHDSTVDLNGSYIIPPFGETHNHNIGTGREDWDQEAINKYLSAGVFYVKVQGNLPMSDEAKKKAGLNASALDVSFPQGSITAPNAHPIPLVNNVLLRQGYFPGYTKESLKDLRYFTVESEQELNSKWSRIIAAKPDFIKLFLGRSNEYEALRSDTIVVMKGLNPLLVPTAVKKAHDAGYRVSAHIINSADFILAVKSGVDEIAHMPRFMIGIPYVPISEEDARLAARQKVVVVTTLAISLTQTGVAKPEDVEKAKQYQKLDLKTLIDAGVIIVPGSDDVKDNSAKELMYLKELGVFTNLQLLNMWTNAAAATIFPKRKIGSLSEGYEANFLVLEANPLTDWDNTSKIKMMFKAGQLLAVK